MSQSPQVPNPKPFSSAFGLALGFALGALYTMPLHGLTIDYFIEQIRPLLHTTFSYQTLWYSWVVILFIAIVTFVRSSVVAVITLIGNLFTSLFVRMSVRQPRR